MDMYDNKQNETPFSTFNREPTQRLDARVIKVWRINSLILTSVLGVILFGAFVALYFFINLSFLFVLVPLTVLIYRFFLHFYLFPKIRYARWRYEILEDEINIKRGIFFIKHIVIPIVRVQFTDTVQGPVLRAFSLADVTITTAGGQISIPGLSLDVANSLRDKIADIAKTLQDET